MINDCSLQYIIKRMIKLFLLILLTLFNTFKCDNQDLIPQVPGYGSNAPRVFAGNFTTKSGSLIAYIYVESKEGNTNPITLWLNGGPGCTSKIGFLSQIGPYFLPANTPYKRDDPLQQNPYSWHKVSNLLFFDTPPGVGYSVQGGESYIYNDANTAQQNLNALVEFFNRYPQLNTKPVFLAGESYAGKFIPDLALKITSYNINAQNKIDLKGILIGNGIMDLSDDRLERSQINYMFTRNFIDPTLQRYWQVSCQTDPKSAGCLFFFRQYDDQLSKINFHNIYGNCSSSNSPKQNSRRIVNSFQDRKNQFLNMYKKCQYYSGLQSYFSLNFDVFNSKKQIFTACNQTVFQLYEQTPSGSSYQFSRLIGQTSIKISLYSGDWDDIVPLTYTIQNLERLGLRQNGTVTHWTNNKNQHVGFKRTYVQSSRLVRLYVLKGAGHEAPSYKRQIAYEMFNQFITK